MGNYTCYNRPRLNVEVTKSDAPPQPEPEDVARDDAPAQGLTRMTAETRGMSYCVACMRYRAYSKFEVGDSGFRRQACQECRRDYRLVCRPWSPGKIPVATTEEFRQVEDPHV